MRLARSIGLILALALAAACNKGKGGGGDSSDEKEGDDKQKQELVPEEPGVVASDDPDNISMAGQLALALLTGEGAPDKVIAFTISGGTIDDRLVYTVADVDADGKFKVTSPKLSPIGKAIKDASRPDGTIDREKLAQALERPVPPNLSDEDLKEISEKSKLATVLVSMVSSGDPYAEAQTFQFIGLPHGNAHLIGIPTLNTKGDLSLGKITGAGDTATAELAASGEVFDLPDATLAAMASTSNALKSLRNFWINHKPDQGESYLVQPFFMWIGEYAKVKNAYMAPADASFNGWGMYLRARGAFTFADVCGVGKAPIKLELFPPAELDAGEMSGKISKDRPFDNGGLTDVKNEGNGRINCHGTDTGFYAASEEGEASKDLMLNWGTGGSISEIPEGYFVMKTDGKQRAAFEIASNSPLDGEGNLKVFLLVPKVNVAADGKVESVEVKVVYRDVETGEMTELTEATAFLNAISGIHVEFTEADDNGNTFSSQFDIKEKFASGVFKLAASDFLDEDSDSKEIQVWYWDGSNPASGGRVVDSMAVQYELYGASYRLEFRAPGYFGNVMTE